MSGSASLRRLATILFLTGAAFLAFNSVDTPQARAQCVGGAGWGGFGAYGFYPGFGFGRNLYAIGNVPTPPYFALHPPVYYGERVRRSYGMSPFAYPPYPQFAASSSHPAAAAPATPPPSPEWVINPFVDPEVGGGESPAGDQVSTPAPQWIVNPFYKEASPPQRLAHTDGSRGN